MRVENYGMKSSSGNGDPGAGVPSVAGGGDNPDKTHRKRPPINESMQHVIGSQLKAAYDEVVKQPVPDRFLELLSVLEGKQGSRS